MKTLIAIFWLTTVSTTSSAQFTQIDTTYHFVSSGNIIQDKNFYFLTLLESDTLLYHTIEQMDDSKINEDCLNNNECYFDQLVWTANKNQRVLRLLDKLYFGNDRLKKIINHYMRPSGYFENYKKLSDTALLHRAWLDAAEGVSRIINGYAFGKGLRYPKIDSASYDISSKYYQGLLQEMIHEYELLHAEEPMPFFKRSLDVAMLLLVTINNRDEAGRFEPLGMTNRSAYHNIATTNWHEYPYSAILVLGEGPEFEGLSISPYGKLRCSIAAKLYKQHIAPFIIVSGGFVHPFQTKFCEAMGMKNYLVDVLGIPGDHVIIEPHARHTTTNLRNANRIVFRNGIPVDKPLACISSRSHLDYVFNKRFEARCKAEIGHVPYKSIMRKGPFQFSYYPVEASLQMDSTDPLDP